MSSSLELRAKKAYQAGAKWLTAAAILAGISVGGIFAYNWLQNRAADPVTVQVTPVELGNVENKISEGGTVELGGQRSIKSPKEGAVDKISVEVGDQISEGQVLMTLRNPEQETLLNKALLNIQKQEIQVERDRQKVAEAEATLKFKQAVLNNEIKEVREQFEAERAAQDLVIQNKQLEIDRQRQRVREAEEELAAAETHLEDKRELLGRGFIARREVDQQEADVRTKRSALRDTKHTLDTFLVQLEEQKVKYIDQEGVSRESVMIAENDLRQAKATLNQNTSELKRLKVEAQEAELKIADNIVTAPISGKVLNVQVKSGDGVNLGDDLISIGDPNQELIQLQLSTLSAAEVEPGQLAKVSVIGPNSTVFTGRVQKIDLQAESASANQNSGTAEQAATVPATVQLDQPTGTLIPGSPVSVEIILDERQDVVVLNTELVQQDGDSSYVWIVDAEDKAQKRSVTLGLEGLLQVEITSGLSPEDTVIQPSPEIPLKPDTPVVVGSPETEPQE
ncbi:MAG: efflux RND transporter periplasmic adaptor subunit [Microcoleaceae cyanobacterium]